MTSQLDQLKTMTVVVADTGDIRSIEQFTPRDATTNPSLITAAAQMPEYQEIVDETLRRVRAQQGQAASVDTVVADAIDELFVAFGCRILDIVPGRVSTEVDARLSYDTPGTIAKARKLIGMYEAAGYDRKRILIKIASTWEGIRAAEQLEQEGIHCNLTLLFGFGQAVACAEAGVTLISPFVGRILDWYKAKTGQDYAGADDPGVQSVTRIYHYYKRYGYRTEVMGASFRNVGEILELAGCDLLTISPKLLDQLRGSTETVIRHLDPDRSAQLSTDDQIHLDAAAFSALLAEDAMAHEKLDEGIRGFVAAIETLEGMLRHRLAQLEGTAVFTHAAHEVFELCDLDGDGWISREEWLGTDAVFDAFDLDHDGRLSQEDLQVGMGAALSLARA